MISGGDKRDRTADLPACKAGALPGAISPFHHNLITNHLCLILVIYTTPFVFTLRVVGLVDLNHRPHPYQGCALTT